MAQTVMKKKQAAPRGRLPRGKIPTKTEINLAVIGEKHINPLVAMPAILLIILLAALFGKFLVVDRLAAVAEAEREVSQLQTQLDAGYKELTDFAELSDLYAHYTFSGMTQEEQTRVARGEVLSLIQRVVLPQAGIDSLSVTDNEMTLNMTGSTLQEINLLVQKLEADPLVNFCTVTTAESSEYNNHLDIYNADGVVTARVVAYLVAETEAAG